MGRCAGRRRSAPDRVSRNTSGVPVVSGDHVIVTSPTALVLTRVRAVDGAIAWQVYLSGRSRGGALVAGGRVYVVQEDGAMAAYSEADGALVGKCTLDSPSTPFTPVVIAGSILFSGENPDLYALPMSVLDRRMSASRPVGCF